jgi:hypothetical protein
MKKGTLTNAIVFTIYGLLISWFVCSLMNTNMANVGEAEIAAWNMFELASQLAEGIKA